MRVRPLYLLIAWLLLSPFHTEAQETRLRATLQLPASDALLGKSLVRFKEDVEKRSNKAISIEIFDKGKLYIDDQTVGAVESGAIETGVRLARLQRHHCRGLHSKQCRSRPTIDGGVRKAADRPLLLFGAPYDGHLQTPLTSGLPDPPGARAGGPLSVSTGRMARGVRLSLTRI